MSTVSGRTSWKRAFIQTVRRMPRGANVISICPILMAMSFHLLVRSSGPLRAQYGSPLQRPEKEFAGELDQPAGRLFQQNEGFRKPVHASDLGRRRPNRHCDGVYVIRQSAYRQLSYKPYVNAGFRLQTPGQRPGGPK